MGHVKGLSGVGVGPVRVFGRKEGTPRPEKKVCVESGTHLCVYRPDDVVKCSTDLYRVRDTTDTKYKFDSMDGVRTINPFNISLKEVSGVIQ